jgi:hypothetical protein
MDLEVLVNLLYMLAGALLFKGLEILHDRRRNPYWWDCSRCEFSVKGTGEDLIRYARLQHLKYSKHEEVS